MVAQQNLSDEQLLLAAIWDEFKKAGYDNDREIIEYLAYLLLNYFLPEKPEPIPAAENITPPRNRYGINETEVRRLLNSAIPLFAERGGLATFFDRYILFYPTKSWRLDTYPIPRHMVDFMLAILQIQPVHRFADFTCGQGGFLVNRYRLSTKHPGKTFGVEISPEMMRLAHANALLHGMNRNNTNFIFGDVFGASALIKSDQLFERIAMAPPFAGEVRDHLVKLLFEDSSDFSYRTLFTRLALRYLAPSGQVALLVPEGLLRNSGSSRKLREELIADHTVKAVITLQAGLFRPYVATPMYILLFQKASQNNSVVESQMPTWFLRIAADGYPLDASRDLTAPPPQKFGDLPLAQAALLPNMGEQEVFQDIPSSGFSYKSLVHTLGIILKVNTNATIFSIRFFQPASHEPYLVVQTSLQGRPSTYAVIPIVQNQAEMEKIQILYNPEAFNKWIIQIFRLPSGTEVEDLPAGHYIFGQGKADQSIVITTDGRLLGFTKTREEMKEAEYILSDDNYWRRHSEPSKKILGVAQLLQEINQNQYRIDKHVENLQGQVEFKQILDKSLPPPLLEFDQFPLLSFLSSEQEQIWQHICQVVPSMDQFRSEGNYAWPFTLDDLLDQARNNETSEEGEAVEGGDRRQVMVEQTLQLLEHLGLIVQVTSSIDGQSRIYYRRVTQLEEVSWETQHESE